MASFLEKGKITFILILMHLKTVVSDYTTATVPTEDGQSNGNKQIPFDWCGYPLYGPTFPLTATAV